MEKAEELSLSVAADGVVHTGYRVATAKRANPSGAFVKLRR